jgi:hypothetical protein
MLGTNGYWDYCRLWGPYIALPQNIVKCLCLTQCHTRPPEPPHAWSPSGEVGQPLGARVPSRDRAPRDGNYAEKNQI